LRVLFLHRNEPDYLADSLFHGLRALLGADCVDVPRYDSLYAPLADDMRSRLRGHGFTLYGLLEEMPALAVERFAWRRQLNSFDFVVISDIWQQWELLWELGSMVPAKQLVVLDGSDHAAVFPYAGWLKKRPWAYATPLRDVLYFKREWHGARCDYGTFGRVPGLSSLFRVKSRPTVRPIAFSIPGEKLTAVASAKTKDFPAQVVDGEVASMVQGVASSNVGENPYPFSDEADYYADLCVSRFGVTTKRAGWDCLRHYELAANGCVLCFRDLDRKPSLCAPHGLDRSNCIIYHDAAELFARISSVSAAELETLQARTREWIQRNTTVARAKAFLQTCLAFRS
jgi:hypothetical protein